MKDEWRLSQIYMELGRERGRAWVLRRYLKEAHRHVRSDDPLHDEIQEVLNNTADLEKP